MRDGIALVGSCHARHNSRMKFRVHIRAAVLLVWLASPIAIAGPYIPAGDPVLRHDIQRLADYGVIKGPTTTWPLAWGPILDDFDQVDVNTLPAAIAASLLRVKDRAHWETRSEYLTFNAKAAGADEPTRIRGFQNTPRGEIELSAGAGYIGEWFSAEVNVQGVDSEQDSKEVRVDNTLVGAVFGNWSVAASTQERWWGPGWDGSLILSNNARPMPALVVDRIFTDPWNTKWLSWMGPWDFSLMFGQMEEDRDIPNAQFFGMRVTLRPLKSLELGLSRSAQWCGDGRPCDAETFVDLLLGNDNRGDPGVDFDNEPGNQLAGLDFRWSPVLFGQPVAFYGQFIGEDEAGGFPSRYLGQVGGEWSGYLADRWSTRVFAEFAGTSCQFHESSEIFNCGYNHGNYTTGYRYRGRSVGHGVDNDARMISVGALLVDDADTQWRATLRYGALNRGGSADPKNTLTPTRQDIVSLDLSHSRQFSYGLIDIGLGFEDIDDVASGTSASNARFYLQWRSSY
ncbi:MAG: capsule assembly Wzi family protein [Gammaproteobacteria bacterium]|nr:capsule assembly Wzi family protein [Gammaproteobacteria bacterium]